MQPFDFIWVINPEREGEGGVSDFYLPKIATLSQTDPLFFRNSFFIPLVSFPAK